MIGLRSVINDRKMIIKCLQNVLQKNHGGDHSKEIMKRELGRK